jgi:hypothetical protein
VVIMAQAALHGMETAFATIGGIVNLRRRELRLPPPKIKFCCKLSVSALILC